MAGLLFYIRLRIIFFVTCTHIARYAALNLQNHEKTRTITIAIPVSAQLGTGDEGAAMGAYRSEIEQDLSDSRFLAALDAVNKMSDEAQAMDSPYGSYATELALAEIFKARGAVELACEHYAKAIDIALKSLPEQSICDLAVNIAELRGLETAFSDEYLTLAEERMHTLQDSLRVYSSKMIHYSLIGRKSKIYNYRRMLLSTSCGTDIPAADAQREKLAVSVITNRYEDAVGYTQAFFSDYVALRLRYSLARRFGMYEAFLETSHGLIDCKDSINGYTSVQELSEAESRAKANNQSREDALREAEAARLAHLKKDFCIGGIAFLLLAAALGFALQRSYKLRQQKKLNKKLKMVSDMKTDFVHNISHEIRTPLNAIMGFSQLLSLPDDFVSEEERKQYGEYVSNDGQMLLMLVNDILSLSDVEQGRINVSYAPVDIHEVIRSSLNSVCERVPEDVTLFSTTDCPDPFTVNTDALRVQQVLINMLTNACKNTVKGEIHVHSSISETPDSLTISVTDTGCGVDPSKAESIFGRFTKLDEHKRGNGLGLCLCRKIAENLQGKIFLDTSHTGGARFVFTLPLMPREN